MVSTRHRVNGLYQVLKYDAAEFCRRSGKRPYAMAREAGIPDRLLRGLDVPDVWAPSIKTLYRIETAFEDSQHWPGSGSTRWRESGSDQGFLLRRVHHSWEHPDFAEVIDAWRGSDDDARRIDQLLAFDGVTLIDARAKDPRNFTIERHSPKSVQASGVDDTGRRLGDHRADFYRDALMSEYLWSKSTGDPQLAEIVWAAEGTKAGAYFRRLVLPVGDRVASVIEVLSSGLTVAEVSSATNRSDWA